MNRVIGTWWLFCCFSGLALTSCESPILPPQSHIDKGFTSGTTVDLSKSFLEVSANQVKSGYQVQVKLTLMGSNGTQFYDPKSVVSFTFGGGQSTGNFGTITDNENGVYTVNLTGLIAGSASTVSALVNDQPITSISLPQVAVLPGDPSYTSSSVNVKNYQVISGNSTSIMFSVRDQAGNLIPDTGLPISFDLNGGSSTGTISPIVDHKNGTYTSTFTGLTSGSPDYIQVFLDGAEIPVPPATIQVLSSQPSASNSVITVSSSLVASGSTATIKLTTNDLYGNPVTMGNHLVSFGYLGGTSTGVIGPVSDNHDGTYTASFTGVTAGTPTIIQGTLDGNPITLSLPTISVIPGPPSGIISQLTVSAASVLSGNSVLVTVVVFDANGNPVLLNPYQIKFINQGGTSSGVFGPVTSPCLGKYQSTFTGLITGTPTTINAIIGASNTGLQTTLGGSLPTVMVVSGTLAPAQSQITVTSPSVMSGLSDTITLTAVDSNGNKVAAGGAIVAFGTIGGSSTGSISSVQDHGDGTYTAMFTGIRAGTPTSITATVNGISVSTGAPTIAVTPGQPSGTLSIISASTTTLPSGSTATVNLQLYDSNGNSITSGGQNVAFSIQGGTSNGTFSSVIDNHNGTYTSTFTGTSAGTPTSIQATVNGSPVISTRPAITVTPGTFSLSNSLITVGTSSIAAGASTIVTLAAKDSSGNQMTSGGLNVSFASSGGTSQGTISVVTDNGNGTYTATFLGTVSGTATQITATINGGAVTGISPTVTVNPGTFSLSKSILTVASGSISSGSSTLVTLMAKDVNGNQITSGGLAVVFSNSGGTSTGSFTSTVDNLNGTYTSTFIGIRAGTATNIYATINGNQVTSSSPSVTVIPGQVSLAQSVIAVGVGSISSGSSTSVTLTAKDANGNQLTSGGLSVVFSNSGGTSNGTFSSVTDNANGVYTATFTGTSSGTATSILATINASPVITPSPSITVAPGAFSLGNSLITVSSNTVQSGSAVTVTLIAKDSNNNQLSSGGLTIAFSTTGGTSTGTFGGTVDKNNGTYVTSFMGITAGTATSVNGSINNQTITSLLPTLTVIPGPISPAFSSVTVSSSSVNLGATASVTLTARDNNGNLLTAGGATVSLALTNSGVGSLQPIIDNQNGTYSTTFTALSGGSTALSGSINGAAITSSLPSINVIGASLTQAIEMIDTPISTDSNDDADDLGTLEVSQTNLNTANFDGQVSYAFEIVVANTTDKLSSNVNLINSSGTTVASITVPPNGTGQPVRYSTSFTPTGSDVYRIQALAPNGTTGPGGKPNYNSVNLNIYTARIVVTQTNASKTSIYIPLLSNIYNMTLNGANPLIDKTSSVTYTQGSQQYYQIWYKNLSDFATLATSNPWQMDAIIWSQKTGFNCIASLTQVGSTSSVTGADMVSTGSTSPVLVSQSFSNNSSTFPDLTNYDVKIRSSSSQGTCAIAKAGLWLNLTSLTKGEVYYRIEKGYSGYSSQAGTTTSTTDGRELIDLSKFSGNVSTFFEVTGWPGNADDYVADDDGDDTSNQTLMIGGNSSDSSTTSSYSLGGCIIDASQLQGGRTRVRSPACTGITNGNRYFSVISEGSSGNLTTSGELMIIDF